MSLVDAEGSARIYGGLTGETVERSGGSAANTEDTFVLKSVAAAAVPARK
jgi:hypothetical protein